MHRKLIVGHLADYARRFPEERAVLERFRRFVDDHPRCFERDCWAGHITGSAWLLDPSGQRVLLTHHRKLDKWLQLGGHSDGDADPRRVALREATEESGLSVAVLDPVVFDLDVHEIPARKSDPAHFHFDVRFALQAADDAFEVSDESRALASVDVAEIRRFTEEESMLRMAVKHRRLSLAG